MMFVSTRTIAESQSVATPRDCRFNVFRGRLESAAQLDRLRQFWPRGLRRGDPFANQLGDRVLELLVLMHRANFYRAHEVIWKIEGSLHCPAIFPESWFSVNGAASARRSNRARQIARSLKSDAEIKVCVEECGVDLQRFSQLPGRLLVAVGVVEGCAQVRVNNWR